MTRPDLEVASGYPIIIDPAIDAERIKAKLQAFHDRRSVSDEELQGPWAKLGWPICDVCNRGVERLETQFDPIKRLEILVAHCHGETEVVELERTLLEDVGMGVQGMRMGRAFVRPLLPTTPSPKKLGP